MTIDEAIEKLKTNKHDLIFTKNNDIIKNKYSKDNNIPLVRIPYWERNKMTLEMLLGKEYLIE